MTSCWFTSDTHYGHERVIEYSRRPFLSAAEMDDALIKAWCAVVKPGDRVYHLGDFSFHRLERTRSIAAALPGQKFLILGNHDKRQKPAAFSSFVWARPMEEIDVGDQKIVLCHYALRTWNRSHRGSWSLYGHSHGSLPEEPHLRSMDVGVDACAARHQGYGPISFEAVAAHMAKKTWKQIDHHRAEAQP